MKFFILSFFILPIFFTMAQDRQTIEESDIPEEDRQYLTVYDKEGYGCVYGGYRASGRSACVEYCREPRPGESPIVNCNLFLIRGEREYSYALCTGVGSSAEEATEEATSICELKKEGFLDEIDTYENDIWKIKCGLPRTCIRINLDKSIR